MEFKRIPKPTDTGVGGGQVTLDEQEAKDMAFILEQLAAHYLNQRQLKLAEAVREALL